MSLKEFLSKQTQSSSPQLKNRRSANFHPTIWADHFLSYTHNLFIEEMSEDIEHQNLKENVEKMLNGMVDHENLSNKLELVDTIQRLGISYHFKTVIDQLLDQVHNKNVKMINDNNASDLHTISLKFRLLRQHGYDISSDIFSEFFEDERSFKKYLTNDVQGLLSLYEATHLRIHGEDTLEEALIFTTLQLKSALETTSLSPKLVAQVTHALKQPIHKGLSRVEARFFIDNIYAHDDSRNEVLLLFAKLDFNILQTLHQKELGYISRWWKDLDVANKLPFARDRLVECYFWILGVYFEPNYIFPRRILTKIIAITSIIDDIYDVYGTLDEIELFTKAVQRWNINSIEQLPDYMKLVYNALLEIYVEIEEKLVDEGNLYRLYYAKQAMKNQVNGYFLEAKWFHSRYEPTLEEYMQNALLSSGYSLLTTLSYVATEDIVTKDVFEWLFNRPKIVKASETVARLMDDITSHKFEQERGHLVSSIECYMKKYHSTEGEAIDEFRKQVANAWKDINEGCIQPTEIPMPLLVQILNLTRVMDVVYKDGDGYTSVSTSLKDIISSLLIKSISI